MATKTRTKQGLKDYLLLLASIQPADPGRQAALLELAGRGDAAAIREMVEAYLPKVLAWCAPRRGEAMSFQELIAIGNCALIESVKNYRGRPADFEAKACLAVHAALDTALKMGA
jgi:DNA-directed RNA polymerase sigma subunit (sigma70/sigma32)